jgi:hypothetical protein
MSRMKKVKEIFGSITAFGFVDDDADGDGNYYLTVTLRHSSVPDKGLEAALHALLRRKVQVIQVGE